MRLLALTAVLAATSAAAQPASGGEAYRQSYALEARGDFAGALAALDPLIAAGSSDYVLQLRRAWLLYSGAKYAESATAYQKAVALEPKAVEPKLGAMLPLMALRRWAEAEKLGNEVLALAPGDFTATSRLAFIHYSQMRYDKAEGFYRKALALFPANVEMRVGLGWTLFKQSKLKEARIELEKALTVAPDHLTARDGLAALP